MKNNSNVRLEFQELASNIVLQCVAPFTLQISSANAKEGKSYVAYGLAKALHDLGKKTLLLDLSLQSGNKVYALGNDADIVDVLQGKASVAEACTQELQGLSILSCTQSVEFPLELLHAKATTDLLQEVKQQFDYIVVDSVSVINGTQAALLAKACDATLLVVQHNATTEEQLQHAVEYFENAGAKLAGAVLNNIHQDDFMVKHYYSKQIS